MGALCMASFPAAVWAEASGMCEREMSSANSTGSVARADTPAARFYWGNVKEQGWHLGVRPHGTCQVVGVAVVGGSDI